MATLELLEESVASFNGTILLISHDRAFMDNVVTSTWVFEKDSEGRGIVKEYVGGYQDYLMQKQREDSLTGTGQSAKTSNKQSNKSANKNKADKSAETAQAEKPKRKLSYHEKRELDELPSLIAKLEEEQSTLQEKLADGTWFSEDLAGATKASERLSEIEEELMAKLERWEELGG